MMNSVNFGGGRLLLGVHVNIIETVITDISDYLNMPDYWCYDHGKRLQSVIKTIAYAGSLASQLQHGC